jgi:N-acetyl-anhydromuramyl-L-alanine amidase AmpD
MKGSEWAATLPSNAGPEREAAILNVVKQGMIDGPGARLLPLKFSPVKTTFNGHTGEVFVLEDCLQIGEPGDAVRFSVTAETEQKIADMLGCLLQTTRVCDLVWQQATVRLEPHTMAADAQMASTARMLEYSRAVEKARAGRPGLVENVGKHWVLTNRLATSPSKAANYGWYTGIAPYMSPSGQKMWQTLGLKHNALHVDYSQVVRLMDSVMVVDGVKRLVRDVGSDPELCGLISSEGVVKVWRQPGVAEMALRTSVQPPSPEPPAPSLPPPATGSFARPSSRQKLSFTRTLRKGLSGADVSEWQSFIRATPDGSFGPQTEAVTKQWQANQGLAADGVVGPATVTAANEEIAALAPAPVIPQSKLSDEPLVTRFIQAKNYTKANRTSADIQVIVIHTAETPETATTAEAIASWAAGSQAPQASWHYGVDSDSIVQSVRDADVAWHAKQANRVGIGIEHAGRAAQSATQWDDDYSQAVLARSARLTASLCQKHSIPPRKLTPEELLAGKRGICGHYDVTLAYKTKGGHTDPGPQFPWDEYLAMVDAEMSRVFEWEE